MRMRTTARTTYPRVSRRAKRANGTSVRTQRVPRAANRYDQRLLKSAVDLRAQIRNVAFDRTGTDVGFVAPNEIEQVVAREDAFRTAQQGHEQFVFQRREIQAPSVTFDGVLVQVDGQAFVLQNGAPFEVGPPQLRIDVREQFRNFERLAQVVVGAGGESLDAIVHLAFGAEHHDRRVGDAAQHRQ